MHDDETWQVFNQNGTHAGTRGYSPAEFRNHSDEIMGNAHLWFWKKDQEGHIEILLQKRALTKISKPGMYHISAGGHINVGESAVEAAVRETSEEMGIDLDTDKLYYTGSMRLARINPNSIVNVYLYELSGDEQFSYVDGEVDSAEWRSLDNFKEITASPSEHNLVDQGDAYFSLLIDSLQHVGEA